MNRSVLFKVRRNAYDACFHTFCQQKLNYTCIKTSDSLKSSLKFTAAQGFLFHPTNYELYEIGRWFEWVPLSLRFSKFHFLPVQIAFSGNFFTKPYDWNYWIQILAGASCLGIITVLYQNINASNIAHTDSIGLSI